MKGNVEKEYTHMFLSSHLQMDVTTKTPNAGSTQDTHKLSSVCKYSGESPNSHSHWPHSDIVMNCRSKKVLCSIPLWGGPFCMEFPCFPCVCVGFLWVLRFPPQSSKTCTRRQAGSDPPGAAQAPQKRVCQMQKTNFTHTWCVCDQWSMVWFTHQRDAGEPDQPTSCSHQQALLFLTGAQRKSVNLTQPTMSFLFIFNWNHKSWNPKCCED